MTASVCVVLPTYNEAENIEAIVSRLFGAGAPGIQVIVVDDQSPDGTAGIVERMKPRFPGLGIINRRGPPGRGLAGRDGYLAALETGADYIVEMDADFSHDPRHIPLLLEAMGSCDVAIGSRFVPGGSDDDRPWWRRRLTLAANAYARTLLELPVEDANSGFRCFNRRALERINPETLRSRGPSIVHETLYRAVLAGLRIREVPIRFQDRKKGSSKLSLARLAAGYFWILRLRLGV